jgi:hypothetical protein
VLSGPACAPGRGPGLAVERRATRPCHRCRRHGPRRMPTRGRRIGRRLERRRATRARREYRRARAAAAPRARTPNVGGDRHALVVRFSDGLNRGGHPPRLPSALKPRRLQRRGVHVAGQPSADDARAASTPRQAAAGAITCGKLSISWPSCFCQDHRRPSSSQTSPPPATATAAFHAAWLISQSATVTSTTQPPYRGPS